MIEPIILSGEKLYSIVVCLDLNFKRPHEFDCIIKSYDFMPCVTIFNESDYRELEDVIINLNNSIINVI